MFDLIINRLRGKRILILGFGREGKSSFHFVQKYLPNAEVAVADKNELEGVKHFGNYYLESMYDYDIVIKTPGISLKDLPLKPTCFSASSMRRPSAFQAPRAKARPRA